jgi:glutathione S-transferase
MNTIRLYELTGADDSVRFSPYCWRVRFALAHKGLEVEGLPWRFSDKDAIAFSGQGRVPVIVDGQQTVSDSWTIAEYLEAHYSERPSLFGSDTSRALTRFINQWTDTALHPPLARLLVPDIYDVLAEQDKEYFRSTREAALGSTIQELRAGQARWRSELDSVLTPLRRTLSSQPYLSGEQPAYADHIVAGTFLWPRVCSSQVLLESGDPVEQWLERMLDTYDGMARKPLGN